MKLRMPGRSHSGPLPKLTDAEAALREYLRAHVQMLGETIGERNIGRYVALEQAADYLEGQLRRFGDAVDRQSYPARGMLFHNLDLTFPGVSTPNEIVVVGAHYDSHTGSPGANDNGTGCAAVLEIARLLQGRHLARTVRFVLFANEETPFFHTDGMGSVVYARQCVARRENVVAMLTPETIGCYSDEPASQRYPAPFNLLYPSVGNFIAFVGNSSSSKLVTRCVESFRRHTQFPSEGGAAPNWVPGIGDSDHWSFYREGFPAVMVTDTAPYRYAQYHTPEDTPDKIHYDHLARVVAGLARVIEDLAGGVV